MAAEDTSTAKQNDRTALDTLPSGRPPARPGNAEYVRVGIRWCPLHDLCVPRTPSPSLSSTFPEADLDSPSRREPVGFQNAAMSPDQRFQAAVSYSSRRRRGGRV